MLFLTLLLIEILTKYIVLSEKEFLLLKKKDSGVITKIFMELKNDIYKFIYYRTGGKPDEADEIFSDSTEALLKYLPNIKYNKNLKSLWMKISSGKISDYYKRKEKHLQTIDNIKEDILINNPEKSSDVFDVEEVYAVYHTALQTINEKYREIIILRYKENRPLDEICKILKADKKSIKNTLFRAKTALSEQMNNYREQFNGL